MIIDIIAVILLTVLAVIDFRKRSLPIYCIVITLVLSVVAGLISGNEYGVFEVIAIAALTIGMYFTSIGRADIFVVLAICLARGFWNGIVIVWLGFLFCGCFGLGLMLGKKATRLSRLALIPFLDWAYILCWIWRLID